MEAAAPQRVSRRPEGRFQHGRGPPRALRSDIDRLVLCYAERAHEPQRLMVSTSNLAERIAGDTKTPQPSSGKGGRTMHSVLRY
jgi:hypothetical protein